MPNTKGLLIELAEVAGLALLLYLIITFAVQTVYVVGPSMLPTAHNQDYLLALRLPYRFHGPNRGDIVIMRSPYNASQDFIKRVVGLPGDRVLIKGCQVWIDDHRLDEPYIASGLSWRNCDPTWPQSGRPQTLGPDEYFVMGDNRDDSTDSRVFGPVNGGHIEAMAWLRIFPIANFGFIDTKYPRLTNQTQPASP